MVPGSDGDNRSVRELFVSTVASPKWHSSQALLHWSTPACQAPGSPPTEMESSLCRQTPPQNGAFCSHRGRYQRSAKSGPWFGNSCLKSKLEPINTKTCEWKQSSWRDFFPPLNSHMTIWSSKLAQGRKITKHHILIENRKQLPWWVCVLCATNSQVQCRLTTDLKIN